MNTIENQDFLITPNAMGRSVPVKTPAGFKKVNKINGYVHNSCGTVLNGFCKDVFQKLPMEFAVEAQKLLGVSLEGSVG